MSEIESDSRYYKFVNMRTKILENNFNTTLRFLIKNKKRISPLPIQKLGNEIKIHIQLEIY